MSWSEWISLAGICALGAVSPGPSLALVLRNTLGGGQAAGVATALAHGTGIGVYALLVALGLAVVVTGSPQVFRLVQLLGAAFLLYLGVQSLRAPATAALAETPARQGRSVLRAAREGFLIAFLNPKIALWFLALFSQFVRPASGLGEKLAMAGLAAAIDASWYVTVASGLSLGPVLAWLRRHAMWIDRVFGLLLIALALRVALLG